MLREAAVVCGDSLSRRVLGDDRQLTTGDMHRSSLQLHYTVPIELWTTSFLPSCWPGSAVEDVVWAARRWERGARRAKVSIAISALRGHRVRV